ncbi:hypothetical protein LUZ63_019705 [Rhynchospora breviuscula]|uniref:Putative rRNA methyltransferase n=1 Tax=Rhynchospora breviuscula TaxID=2022672 RepID=A0A9Q0C6R9_9POAL|nr:hypothetical protein LUZ63_019705 [Rhynchospora breviuscula]
MGKAKGSQRLDKYYRFAKETGYRSRASFKLLQLDARYKFLSSARAVLDLCAAPGGWMQVAVQKGPVASLVLGVDLAPIRPMQGATSLIADITTTKCRAAVKKVLEQHGAAAAFDVILHDGSPNVGGAWSQEATTQSVLVIESVRMATEFLAPKGTFVTKVFRSQDYTAILFCLKQLFEKVEATKPAASRSTSAEIYVIAQRYKAPARIDPHLLDVKYLFQGALERPKVKDVLHPEKQKRHRDGYEEGNPTLWKVGTAADFIWSEAPLEYLGTVNTISFDNPASLQIKNHELTTDEIKSLCEDLYVLDKNSFKHLLKWRIRVKNVLSSKAAVAKEASDEKTEKLKPDEDEQLLNEMEELTNIIDRNKKKDKKRIAKRRQKDKVRTAMGMQKDATEDGYVDTSLFSLSSIKGRKDLQAVETTELNDGSDFSESEGIDEQQDAPSEEDDSDEEQSRYDQKLEEMLDVAYERYVTRKGGSLKEGRKRLRRADPDADIELLEESEEEEKLIDMDQESDKDQDEEDANPLMVPLDTGKKPTKEQLAEMWFSQDIFTESGAVGPTEKSDSDEEREEELKSLAKPKTKTKTVNGSITSTEADNTSTMKKSSKEKDDFEIVPQEPPKSAQESDSDSDSDSSIDDDDLDDDTKAEVLAYAKKMLRKKQRDQILDDAYNKYMFDDQGLPTWFLEEEKRHRQLNKPVTKEEVEAMKAQFREIDARPSKKVAEAKARKKRVALKQLEKARKKADAIADQTDISEHSKRKMIDRLYKKAAPKKPQKEYVVAKKGVRMKVGKGKVLVDPRMKKDKRATGAGAKGKKGKGKKGKVKGGKGSAAKGKGGKGGAAKGNVKGKGRK